MGRPRKTDLRSVFDAIWYIHSTGCQWRALPGEYPPFSTVQNYFYGWRRSGVPGKILRRFRDRVRCSLCGAEHGRDRQLVGEDHGEWQVITRARGSRAASGTLPWTRKAARLSCWFTRLTSRTGTLPWRLSYSCWRRCRRSPNCMPMVAMRDRNFARRSGNRACQTSSRLWKNRRIPRASRCCPAGGSWSGPLPGWADAVACRRITSATLTMPWPGCNWPPVDFLSGAWRVKQLRENK